MNSRCAAPPETPRDTSDILSPSRQQARERDLRPELVGPGQESLEISQKRVSEIERGQVDFTKVDSLGRYADALGGTLRVEVQVGDEAFQIA